MKNIYKRLLSWVAVFALALTSVITAPFLSETAHATTYDADGYVIYGEVPAGKLARCGDYGIQEVGRFVPCTATVTSWVYRPDWIDAAHPNGTSYGKGHVNGMKWPDLGIVCESPGLPNLQVGQIISGSYEIKSIWIGAPGQESRLTIEFHADPVGVYAQSSGGGTTVTWTTPETKPGWIIKKSADGDNNKDLSGALFAIFSDPECQVPVTVNGGVPLVVETRYNGSTDTSKYSLAPGKYYTKELKPPKGFILSEEDKERVYEFEITAGGVTPVTVPNTPEPDTPPGDLELLKVSSLPGISSNNNCYSLGGAVYEVWHEEEQKQPDGTTKTVTVDDGDLVTKADGTSNTLSVESGYTYYAREVATAHNFWIDTKVHEITVTPDGDNTFYVSDVPAYDNRTLEITKIDSETGVSVPLGAASLAGAVFEVRYFDNENGNINGTPKRTWYIETQKNGGVYGYAELTPSYLAAGYNSDDFYYASGSTPVLPVGTYSIQEVKAPEGYLLAGAGFVKDGKKISANKKDGTYYVTQVTKDGNSVGQASIKGYGISLDQHEQVKRGDIEFRKKDAATGELMPFIPFKITSLTTGESHIVRTDENGYFSSHWDGNEYCPHTFRTNILDNCADGDEASKMELPKDGSEDYDLDADFTGRCGTWFFIDREGNQCEADDALRAFPYDSYRIEELRCENNEGRNLIVDEFTIRADDYEVDLGTMDDVARGISTSAKDQRTGTHYAMIDDNVTIIDTVQYWGLTPGKEYKLRGYLVDKDTDSILVDECFLQALSTFLLYNKHIIFCATLCITYRFIISVRKTRHL